MTSTRELQRQRSTTWLRNTGVGREMLRLIQAKGSPVRRIFRQLAELGVPCSMAEGLIGRMLKDWDAATPREEAKLQALWSLAEAYTDVANRVPGSVEGLGPTVDEALALGVWYEPPSCAAVVIDRRANKVRRFVEDIEGPCRPGRTQSHDRLWRQVLADAPAKYRLTPELGRVVELRLQVMTTSEIADAMGKSEPTIMRMLKMQIVQDAIEEVTPIAELEQKLAQKVRAKQAASRARTMKSEARQAARKAEAIEMRDRKAIEAKAQAQLARRERMRLRFEEAKARVGERQRRLAEAREARALAEAKVAKRSPGRPRKDVSEDDAWLLSQLEQGVTVYALAAKLGTTRQALTYRIGRVRRAMQDPHPIETN